MALICAVCSAVNQAMQFNMYLYPPRAVVPTDQMTADIMTKSLLKQATKRGRGDRNTDLVMSDG